MVAGVFVGLNAVPYEVKMYNGARVVASYYIDSNGKQTDLNPDEHKSRGWPFPFHDYYDSQEPIEWFNWLSLGLNIVVALVCLIAVGAICEWRIRKTSEFGRSAKKEIADQ
jgi:hypothetical protein